MPWHGWKIISRHGPEHLWSCECWRYSLPVFALTLFSDPMIARSSMQSRQTLSINIPVVLIIIKGNRKTGHRRSFINEYVSNFTQFYSTKSERERNLRREYDAQIEYRKHLQAFIDRWRYNANRAAQAQSKIKILEKVRVSFSTAPRKLIDCAASRAYSASGRGNREI